ncbi:MAG TPA: DinB family protein, partial [Anaerolineae bacterium]|nr:DinB family protein [Anaerolineae bacterium]
MTPDALRMIYEYTYWAFELVWDCIMQLTDSQFTEHIDYSMGSIRHHIVHMMSSTHRWLPRIQGEGREPLHLRFEDYATRLSTKAHWDMMREDVLSYVGYLSQEQLQA